MRIGLIRHGETDWNAQMKLQGSTDIPLNERGVEQAQDAAKLLQRGGWSRIGSSPLGRAKHTASIIAVELGLEQPFIVPGMIERSFGELEGKHVYQPDGSRLPIDHPTVEPVDAVVTRSLESLSEIAAQYRGEDVLILTHGSVVRLTLDALLPWKAPHISNVALSVLETDQDAEFGFVVRSANGYPINPQ